MKFTFLEYLKVFSYMEPINDSEHLQKRIEFISQIAKNSYNEKKLLSGERNYLYNARKSFFRKRLQICSLINQIMK